MEVLAQWLLISIAVAMVTLTVTQFKIGAFLREVFKRFAVLHCSICFAFWVALVANVLYVPNCIYSVNERIVFALATWGGAALIIGLIILLLDPGVQ